MIKPFKVLETRIEQDGATGVLYEVWKVTSDGATRSSEERMRAYMHIPIGEDIDNFLFAQLSKAGWF